MKALLVCLMLCFVSGCAAHGPIGSFAGPLPEHNAVSAIAADAVALLTDIYPPGHTALHVLPAKGSNAFAPALENALRAKGFTLAAEDSADAVNVAYTLDNLEEKAAWYLRLRITEGGAVRVMARVYDAHGNPEAGQSRIVLEVSQSGLGKAVDAVKEKANHAYEAGRDFLHQQQGGRHER